jgi:hypothetical protein
MILDIISLEDQFDHVVRKAATSEILPDNLHARKFGERLSSRYPRIDGGQCPELKVPAYELR